MKRFKAHLTRVCDSNERLVTLATTIGPVAVDGLKKGLDSLDIRLKACKDHIDKMLEVCAAKDYDAIEAQRDSVYKLFNDNREMVLEAIADISKAAPAPAAAGGVPLVVVEAPPRHDLPSISCSSHLRCSRHIHRWSTSSGLVCTAHTSELPIWKS